MDEPLADMEQHLLELDPLARYRAVERHLCAAYRSRAARRPLVFRCCRKTTHLLENLLDGARRQEMSLSTEIINLFLETKDIMQEQLDVYKTSQVTA